MNLDRVTPGDNTPESINVIIEIPAHSDPVKYEVDKKTGAMFVDRFMNTAMHYPCNYGYIPHTLSDDGDPVDVLVITPFPLASGSVIKCRPIGLLQMEDEKGEDVKVLSVPMPKMYYKFKDANKPEDVGLLALNRIAHFFKHYKDLEENKWVRIADWQGQEKAYQEINNSIERFNKSPEKLYF